MTDLEMIREIQNRAARWATEYSFCSSSYTPEHKHGEICYVWIFDRMTVSIIINTANNRYLWRREDFPFPYIHMLPSDRKL